jgi:hypothetical protein
LKNSWGLLSQENKTIISENFEKFLRKICDISQKQMKVFTVLLALDLGASAAKQLRGVGSAHLSPACSIASGSG